jgi:CHAT domain-containing protein
MSAIVQPWQRALLAIAAIWLCMAADCQAEGAADLGLLARQVDALADAKRFADALPLAEQVVAIAEGIEGVESEEVARRLLKLAELLSELGRFSEAAPKEQRALHIRERLLGPEHPDTVQAMVSLAGSLKELKRFDEAAALYRQALTVYEKTRGPKAAELAEPLVQLDDIARLTGRAGERAALNRRLLALREVTLGSDHADLVPVLLNLANSAVNDKQLDEALAFLERALTLRLRAGGADDPVSFEILMLKASLLGAQKRPADAEPLLRRVLAYREKSVGLNSPAVAEALIALGGVLKDLARFADAAPLYEQALTILEKTGGLDGVSLLPVLAALATLRSAEGRFDELEHVHLRSLAIRQRHAPPNDPDTLAELKALAGLYHAQGRFGRAEPLYRQVVAGIETSKGKDAADLASPLYMLALQLVSEARYAEAGPLLHRALAIEEAAYGRDDPHLAEVLAALSRFYLSQSDGARAEPLLKRILDIASTRGGVADSALAISLNHLSQLYQERGRAGEALPLAQQALAIMERTSGPEHPIKALLINNLSVLYSDLGRDEESEALYKRALANVDKALPGDHPFRVKLQLNLAAHYRSRHRFSEAEPLLQAALASSLRLFGESNPQVADTLQGLAALRIDEGRNGEAAALLERSASVLERTLGPDDPGLSAVRDDSAKLALARSDWLAALEHWRASTDAIIHRAQRGTMTINAPSGRAYDEAGRWSSRFKGALKAAWRVGDPSERGREAFVRAQWAQGSAAATSLAQMAARSAKGDPELSQAVRERQDLVGQWQLLDAARVAAIAQPLDKRDPKGEAATAARLAAIDKRLGEIDARFAKDFPDYAALASAQPASAADVQSSLRDDEALVLLFDTGAMPPTPEETFIWVVTRRDVRWVRSNLGTMALQERVAALRCGLDREGEWRWSPDKEKWLARKPACEALQPEGLEYREALPFDPVIAHELYEGLFGGIGKLIKGKHLLIVPSGALTSLPFQVLVTKPPVPGQDYRSFAWLARGHALTVLPSAASLVALRRNARPSSAAEPFIGFGNPVLAGRCGPVTIPRACPDEELQIAGVQDVAKRSAGGLRAAGDYLKEGLADVAALRQACPLPDTAHELKCVAKSLGAPATSLVLGKDMTEVAVKKMLLDHYRIVHFATHGLLAGETERFTKTRSEPALLFTPPENATDEDDGLLTASEIAGLKLDADWVVMSACNTASGEKPGAEALSGLAKAFFYAGARALLVSHWPVNTNAATLLNSRTFAELRSNKSIGRAEAFRRAMLALIDDKQRPWAAHPSVWAPFVVVGEGAQIK